VPVEDISLRRPTLDEVFLSLTGRPTTTTDSDSDIDNKTTTTTPTGPREDAA